MRLQLKRSIVGQAKQDIAKEVVQGLGPIFVIDMPGYIFYVGKDQSTLWKIDRRAIYGNFKIKSTQFDWFSLTAAPRHIVGYSQLTYPFLSDYRDALLLLLTGFGALDSSVSVQNSAVVSLRHFSALPAAATKAALSSLSTQGRVSRQSESTLEAVYDRFLASLYEISGDPEPD